MGLDKGRLGDAVSMTTAWLARIKEARAQLTQQTKQAADLFTWLYQCIVLHPTLCQRVPLHQAACCNVATKYAATDDVVPLEDIPLANVDPIGIMEYITANFTPTSSA